MNKNAMFGKCVFGLMVFGNPQPIKKKWVVKLPMCSTGRFRVVS